MTVIRDFIPIDGFGLNICGEFNSTCICFSIRNTPHRPLFLGPSEQHGLWIMDIVPLVFV
jgi:hypothetical protein